MNIEAELDQELKDALRSQDKLRLDVLRQIRTEVAKAAAEPGAGDEDSPTRHERIIAAYVKKMVKAHAEYETYGERGAHLRDKLAFEIDYLQRWLPAPASEDDVAGLVSEAIAETGANDPKQAGRVIGAIMKEHPGLDGAVVDRLVRETLGA